MAASFAIIGTSRASRIVGGMLNAPCIEQLDAAPDSHLLMVASAPNEVMSVRSAVGQGIPLLAVVAWELPEDSLGTLADLGVPVLVGLEGREELEGILEGQLPAGLVREEASRLALFEKLLAGRPRGELSPPQDA